MNKKGYMGPREGPFIAGSVWPLIIAIISATIIFLLKIFWKPIRRRFK